MNSRSARWKLWRGPCASSVKAKCWRRVGPISSSPKTIPYLISTGGITMTAADYAIGVDLSFLKQAEDGGAVFKENGHAKTGRQIFKDHAYRWIRLRLFHTPTELPNSLEYTIAQA